MCTLVVLQVLGAGIEHPDNGAIAIGRGGAVVANPASGMALQYNPAGLAQHTGLLVHLDAKFASQGLEYTPADPGQGVAASNDGGLFFAPAGALVYGLGDVGPLSALTFALGGFGPSAIGKLNYDPKGAQRYALIDSDYFIAFLSFAAAARYSNWLQFGANFMLVQGHAAFSQAVWAGTAPGTDPKHDATARIDVTSGFIPSGVLGLTVHPTDRLSVGLSFWPRIHFEADGTLTAGFSELAKRIGAEQHGDSATLKLKFPDIWRLGVQYRFAGGLEVELDGVMERWSLLKEIVVQPNSITVAIPAIGTERALDTIIFPKHFRDAYSARAGGELPLSEHVRLRAGYLYETSAVPNRTTSVDFGNWDRHAVSLGASLQLFGAWLDLGYAHHFVGARKVGDSAVQQVVAPCITTTTCDDVAPSVVGNGDYEASLDLFALSVRVPLDVLQGAL
jgi:long-subunit fatty acid transport protein